MLMVYLHIMMAIILFLTCDLVVYFYDGRKYNPVIPFFNNSDNLLIILLIINTCGAYVIRLYNHQNLMEDIAEDEVVERI